jgi:hypothetical protein
MDIRHYVLYFHSHNTHFSSSAEYTGFASIKEYTKNIDVLFFQSINKDEKLPNK